MTPALLASIGQTLYGPNWLTPLARAIGRSDRTVARLRDGEYPITEDVARAVTALVMTKKRSSRNWRGSCGYERVWHRDRDRPCASQLR